MNPLLHLELLERADRLLGLREALRRTVTPTSRLLDAGCGSGLLSVWARQLGAGDVLGVDVDSVDLARRVAEHNEIVGGLQFLSADLFDDSVTSVIGERDVIIGMLFLNDPRRDERQVDLGMRLRERHLAAHGQMIPSHIKHTAHLADWPAQDHQSWQHAVAERTSRLSHLYGVDLSPLGDAVNKGVWRERFPTRTAAGRYPDGAFVATSRVADGMSADYRSGVVHWPEFIDLTATTSGTSNVVVWTQQLWFEDILLLSNESVTWLDAPVASRAGECLRLRLGDVWREKNVAEVERGS